MGKWESIHLISALARIRVGRGIVMGAFLVMLSTSYGQQNELDCVYDSEADQIDCSYERHVLLALTQDQIDQTVSDLLALHFNNHIEILVITLQFLGPISIRNSYELNTSESHHIQVLSGNDTYSTDITILSDGPPPGGVAPERTAVYKIDKTNALK